MGTVEERLRACISVEAVCAEAYEILKGVFARDAGAQGLWEELAQQEEKHVGILTAGRVYERLGKLSDNVVPHEWPLINEAMDKAVNLKWVAARGSISLEDALRMTLSLEKSIVESYFFEVMKRETDSATLKRLQGMYEDEKTHVEMIEGFMRSRGIPVPA